MGREDRENELERQVVSKKPIPKSLPNISEQVSLVYGSDIEGEDPGVWSDGSVVRHALLFLRMGV